jgi:RNase P/RNase MRP subunit POP5
MRAVTRYIAVAGCEGREEEALAEVERNLEWLLGAMGGHWVRLRIRNVDGICAVEARLRRGDALDAVIFAIALSEVGGGYLRPVKTSGTLRGLLERLKDGGTPDWDGG